MPRKSYVQIDGVLYEKGSEPERQTKKNYGPAIIGDVPEFVSIIDGTIVRGRAGIRDQCARHNVVPTADLKGLPERPQEVKLERNERIQDIVNAMRAKGHWHD